MNSDKPKEAVLLVLAAGRGVGIDGFSKLRLTSPVTGETIMARYVRQFGHPVSVVIGYRGAEVASSFPDLDYHHNPNWFESGSAYSAHVGLERAPVTIVPSDLFIDDALAEAVNATDVSSVFAVNTENRSTGAFNVSHRGETLLEIYQGPKRSGADPEFAGIIKIVEQETVAAVSETCLQNPSLSLVECVLHHRDLFRVAVVEGGVTEVNTIEDYLSYLSRVRGQ